MDIITHTLSGVAVAAFVSNVSGARLKDNSVLVLCGALAGAFPDIDAISLWSGFDATFGKWFELPASGRTIYSGNYWYSHHAFLHSLLASVLFSLCFVLVFYLYQRFVCRQIKVERNRLLRLGITFLLAYNVHLFQDMLTPSGSWGGIAYWWPGTNYVGGLGYIWWWNNYDLFLIVLGLVAGNVLIKLVVSNRRKVTIFVTSILVLSLLLSGYQIYRRDINYNYKGSAAYQKLEQHSVEEQQRLIGDELVQLMQGFDQIIPLAF